MSSRSPAIPAAAASPRGAYALLVAMILLWGVNWPIMKAALVHIAPLWFSAARVLMGSATLFIVLALGRRLAWPARRDLPIVLSVGLLQMALYMSLVNFALLHVGAGRSAILAYTTPLWVVPGAVVILRERITALKLLGLLLGLGGIAVLFNPFGFDWTDRNVVIGNLLLMLAAFVWAGVILHIRRHVWHLTPLQLAPWQMLVAALPLVGLALWFEGDAQVDWSPTLVAILAYNGPVATAFCFWASVAVARALPAITTSLAFLGVPVVGVAASTLSLGEPLTATLVVGFGLILGGLILVNLADLRHSRR